MNIPSAGSRVNVYKVALLSPGGAYRVDAHVVTTDEDRARSIVSDFIKFSELYQGAQIGAVSKQISIVDTEAFMEKQEPA